MKNNKNNRVLKLTNEIISVLGSNDTQEQTKDKIFSVLKKAKVSEAFACFDYVGGNPVSGR